MNGFGLQILNGIGDSGSNYNKSNARNIMRVGTGLDFANFKGDSTIEDDERILLYLKRTYSLFTKNPEYNSLVYNAEKANEYQTATGGKVPSYSSMVKTVIDAWDTNKRESVLAQMSNIEESLISNGILNYQLPAEKQDLISELPQAAVKKPHGMFSFILILLHPFLFAEEIDFVANNPFLTAYKQLQRQKTHTLRKKEKPTSESVNGLLGLGSTDDFTIKLNCLVKGSTLYISENKSFNLYKYLKELRELLVSNPNNFFADEKEYKFNISALDRILKYWNSDLRDAVVADTAKYTDTKIGHLAGGLSGMLDWLKKLGNKVADFFRKLGSKTFRQLLWNKLGQLVKKVIKFIVRYNPITIMMRSATLFLIRCNIFELATRNYVGILTKSEALKLGYSDEQYAKAVTAWEKVKKVYENIGGDSENLKKTIITGANLAFPDASSITVDANHDDRNFLKKIIEGIFKRDPKTLEMAANYKTSAETEDAQRKANGEISDENLDTATYTSSTEVEEDLNNNDLYNIFVSQYNAYKLYRDFIHEFCRLKGWKESDRGGNVKKLYEKLEYYLEELTAGVNNFPAYMASYSNTTYKVFSQENFFKRMDEILTKTLTSVESVEKKGTNVNIINPSTFFERFADDNWLSEPDATHLQAFKNIVIPQLAAIAKAQAALNEDEDTTNYYSDFFVNDNNTGTYAGKTIDRKSVV